MTLAEQLSEFNIVNSVSEYIAGKLLEAGYVVYWHARDALQLNATDWYFEYSTNYPTYLAVPAVLTAMNAAKGIVTLGRSLPAEPRFVARPTLDGSVLPQDAVGIPALSVEVGPAQIVEYLECGTRVKRWFRHLLVDGYARTQDEQGRFTDYFALWFEPDIPLSIYDHDAGTRALIDTVLPLLPNISRAQLIDQADAITYQLVFNARLEYFA
jgi:hypothetical protein